MSVVAREVAPAAQAASTPPQANGEVQKFSQLATDPSSQHLILDTEGIQHAAQSNGSYASSSERNCNPPSASFSAPKHNTALGTGPNALADFFSTKVFRIVLHNPTTAHRLLKYTQARMCGENMEFLEKVDRYNALLDELTTVMTDIHYSYTSVDAPKQIGISVPTLNRINADIKTSTTTTLPAMESIFGEAQDNVEEILRTAVYPRFVKHQMTNSASKALSQDREKYQGLGDCFCLTDPAKADNPIVFASDGFVNVTGYTRQEIVPRNCRFLQGNYTDRAATMRLKESIDKKEETVELLLNYKKSGEPFWNLVYVAPLYDGDGNLTFYIGGQINCSTTIRSNTDVLRILSASDEPIDDHQAAQSAYSQHKPLKRRIFGFRRKESTAQIFQSTKKVEVRKAGMEHGLLKQIGQLNFRTQMEKFYTAYSKYFVIRYSDFTIQHYSAGLVDMFGINTDNNSDFVGSDVFRFLGQHAASLPREFKSKVKFALENGQAISASINLFTTRSLARSRADDKFFTHWTPTKDEHGEIKYVLTMSSTMYD